MGQLCVLGDLLGRRERVNVSPVAFLKAQVLGTQPVTASTPPELPQQQQTTALLHILRQFFSSTSLHPGRAPMSIC